ncbi:RraA family protein [Rhizomonospora bruguierae]|uniref:RraA family protein n=1 Tax=Rhizomonospora bruguierae TaxID=1581705 RepID=UPI001BCAD297|nr:hypothetical protein [Micromonospora sp. NBRC 107566]
MAVECLLHPETPLPDPELIRRIERLATSLISDVFGRWAGTTGLYPVAALAPGRVVAGPAFTVRTRAGDNLVVHKSLDLIRPGEILVVAAGGATDRAILGGLMGQYASTRGVAAIMVDGAVRDRSDLESCAPPVFAKGLNHLGPYKDGPGELRCPVALGGVAVEDGDIVVGDEDGIAVLPRWCAEDIVALAEAKQVAEAQEAAAISRGEWDRSWIDRALRVRSTPPIGERQ